jgi:hypothetical protein
MRDALENSIITWLGPNFQKNCLADSADVVNLNKLQMDDEGNFLRCNNS